MKPRAQSEKHAHPTTLVIGYGSALRGDDGVGPAIAEWVEQQNWPGVTALVIHQLFPETAEEIARHDRVIFVDADLGGSTSLVNQPLEEASDRLMAHRCSPGALLRMARELYGAQTIGRLITIPARNFDIAPEFSPKTQHFIGKAQALLEKLCSENEWKIECTNSA
ncbi:MAG: hydrogenase maturation protease [Kiritimatiellae bacterium]|nr:hydrogenase maturation protease [Kiritimatiellia bacterium]